MSARESLRIRESFQWIVIPHGAAYSPPGSNEKPQLRLTLRVVPQVFKGAFGNQLPDKPRLRNLSVALDREGVAALMDWPRFVDSIESVEIAFANRGANSAPMNLPVSLKPDYAATLRKHGASRELASRIWQAMFGPKLRVDPKDDVGSEEFSQQSTRRKVQRLFPMQHARGARKLRETVGRLHAAPLAAMLNGDRSRARQPYTGVVEVSAEPRGVPELDDFARSLSRLSPRPGYGVFKNIIEASNHGDLARLCDLERVLAVGLPFSPGGFETLSSRITSWNIARDNASFAYPPEPGRFELHDFMYERVLALAPDLPIRQDSKPEADKVNLDEPAENDSEAPEFHRDLSKLSMHSWLLEVLGLSIELTMDLPADLNGDFGVFAASVTAGGRALKPDVQIRVMTSAGAGWHPLEQAAAVNPQHESGCARLSNKDGTPDKATFVLEQLDVDSTLEKLIGVVQTEASQFEAGVIAGQRDTKASMLRTSGLSLLKRKNDSEDKIRAERVAALQAAVDGGVLEFFAEDLVIGYRPDICAVENDPRGTSCRRPWRSLNSRELTRLVINGRDYADDFATAPTDEAFVSPHARLLDGGTSDNPRLLFFEELFCWRGWSLAASQIETREAPHDMPRYLPSIGYRSGGGLPKQRFGSGYLVGMRLVYMDGRSISLEEASAQYEDIGKPEVTLGTGHVGGTVSQEDFAQRTFLAPFLRYEAILPAINTMRDQHARESSGEKIDRMRVSSNGRGRLIDSVDERTFEPPRFDLDNAIRSGAFDDPALRRRAPSGGDVPDPWATRLIVGFYRPDGGMLRLEYFDYYDAVHPWPNYRKLTVRLQAVVDESLPVSGFETRWENDTLYVRLGAGVTIHVRHWHEIDERQLAMSGAVDAIADWLSKADAPAAAADRAALGLEDCEDYCDLRDKLIERLSRWHLKFPFDLRPFVAAGRPARELNITSFSVLNPAGAIELAHAVPVPAHEPVFSQGPRQGSEVTLVPLSHSLVAHRFDMVRDKPGQTVAEFHGDIEFHRASTVRVDCFAAWDDLIDEPGSKRPQSRSQKQQMFRVDGIRANLEPVPTPQNPDEPINPAAVKLDIPPDSDFLMLDKFRDGLARHRNQDLGTLRLHYDFEDTKARLVSFQLQATSRYASDFPTVAEHHRDATAEESRWLMATKPPAKPDVAFIVPLFERDTAEDDGVVRQRRRGGWIRIWLERPWYSSGAGELLALVCWPPNLFRPRGGSKGFLSNKTLRAWGSLLDGSVLSPKQWPHESLERLYTGWGLDPIWDQMDARLDFMPPGVFVNRLFPDQTKHVLPSQLANLKLDSHDDLKVALALYRPEFDEAERRWFVDVQIAPDDKAYFPFVRLGLARYQPNAIENCELSEIVASEFVQLSAHRSATVKVRPDKNRLHLVDVAIHGQASPAPSDLQGTHARTRILLRIDEAVGNPGSGAPRAWMPLQDSERTEEVELHYQGNQIWRGSAKFQARSGREYSAYLEEREGIVVDASPTSGIDEAPCESCRVTYVDRLPLRT